MPLGTEQSSPMPVRNNTNRVPYFKDCPKPLTFSPRNIIIIKRTKFACLAQPVEHAAVNRSVGGSSPSTGAKKHLIKGAFFLPCLGTWPPRALRAFGTAEMTLRTPHWTRSALRATIAIPSLRSLRGFESLSGSPPKVFSVGLFQAPENTSSRGVFSRPVWGHDPRALCALSAQPK